MKRFVLLAVAASLLATPALAGGLGVRAGLTMEPDQFHVGGHYNMDLVNSPLRFVPNVEVGFGDDLTLVALNGDLLYDFADTPWSVGGELGFLIANYDLPVEIPGFDDSQTDIGLSAVGNYMLTLNSGKPLLLEVKLGISDAPDWKFTVGWGF